MERVLQKGYLCFSVFSSETVSFLRPFLLLLANTRRLRWLGLLALGAIVRFGTEIGLNAGIPGFAAFRLPLFAFAFGLLLAGCWANRRVPGFGLILAGTFANLVPVMLNGGAMPIWAPALTAAGFTQADVHSAFHTLIFDAPGPAFLLRGWTSASSTGSGPCDPG